MEIAVRINARSQTPSSKPRAQHPRWLKDEMKLVLIAELVISIVIALKTGTATAASLDPQLGTTPLNSTYGQLTGTVLVPAIMIAHLRSRWLRAAVIAV